MGLLLSKKPRVNPALVFDWHGNRLTTQEDRRYAALHAIALRQYNRKDTEFIIKGLIDSVDNIHRIQPLMSQSSVGLDVAVHMTLPVPWEIVSRAVWQLYNGETQLHTTPSTQVALERLDKHTVYEHCTESQNGEICHANSIRKLFSTNREHVIVLRSVLDDELSPRASKAAVEDLSLWLCTKPLDDSSCHFTFVVRFVVDTQSCLEGVSPKVLERVKTSFSRAKMEMALPAGGVFIAPQQIPQVLRAIPGYISLVDRSNRNRLALQTTLKALVRNYRKQPANALTNGIN
ncbi:hypothetical protein Ae201684P_021372 [Aphanomyces euteiches]|nr:hypothetical protein Ae201684P_021372 [Aphanomyces euteiches]